MISPTSLSASLPFGGSSSRGSYIVFDQCDTYDSNDDDDSIDNAYGFDGYQDDYEACRRTFDEQESDNNNKKKKKRKNDDEDTVEGVGGVIIALAMLSFFVSGAIYSYYSSSMTSSIAALPGFEENNFTN